MNASNHERDVSGAVIASWELRAEAYAALTQRWPLFRILAERLISWLPRPLVGPVLDLGAGAGLASQALLALRPQACVHLVEPAGGMLALARSGLGDRAAGYHQARAREVGTLGIPASAVLCSSVFHLLDEAAVLPAAAAALVPGGLFATNLWAHSYVPMVDKWPAPEWRVVLDQVLSDFGKPPRVVADRPPARLRDLEDLKRMGLACGLELIEERRHDDTIKMSFFLEFAALSSDFLGDVEAEERAAILTTARTRLCSEQAIPSAALLFRKLGV